MDGKRVSIGIDLGTTYSCVGYWRDNGVEIIPNDIGKRITPSFVAFTDEGPLVGEEAYNQVTFNIHNTIFDIKRLIGRRFSEETVQNDIKLWPFKVIAGRDDKPMISVTTDKGETKEYTPEEISSMVLGKLKKLAEDYIGSEVEDAVITVPACFDHCQRQATIDAGKIAGLNVLRLINEPTAAAIAYGLDQNSSSVTGKRNVLVFDLGGGKLDVSFLIVTNDNIEIKAVGGDSHLGGEDFDNRSVQHFVEIFKRKYKHDISGNPRALRRLRTACERAKRSLSIAKEAMFNIDELYVGIDFVEKFTRSEFEELNSDLFDKCIESVKKCLMDAKMNKNDVDDVILAGGSSRIPKIQQLLTEFLNGQRLSKSINLDEVVAHGAAIQAAILSGQGIEKFRNLVLMDVTPLSLGIEIRGRVVYVIIPKNTAIPTKVVREFTTAHDNQTSIAIRVFEGERVMSRDNRLLGEMMLTGIKPAPRRVPTVEVCFNLQADGILDVSAKDKGTGLEISTTIKDTMKLSGEDIQRMMKEANEYKANDEMYRRRGEARYAFETYICNLRNELNVRSGRMKAKNAVDEAFRWLDSMVQLAEVSEYEEKKKYLMSVMKA